MSKCGNVMIKANGHTVMLPDGYNLEQEIAKQLSEHAARMTDRMFAAHHFSVLPQRFICGVNQDIKNLASVTKTPKLYIDRDALWQIPSDGPHVHWGTPTLPTKNNVEKTLFLGANYNDLSHKWEIFDTRQKESAMIEKKNFVTPPVKTPAGSLAQRHLGSLVTITLPSGAEITDILVGVRSGVPVHRTDLAATDVVVLYLKNVGVGYDPQYLVDRNGEFPLDSKSVVLVRRPKVVKKSAAKR